MARRYRIALGLLAIALVCWLAVPSQRPASGEQRSVVAAGCPDERRLSVSVVMDSGWIRAFGLRAGIEALEVLRTASALFEPYCLGFEPAELFTWPDPRRPSSARLLHARASRDLQTFRGRFLLVLSGRHVHGLDGYAGDRVAVVVHHPHHFEQDVVVAAHELGHLLGLSHHGRPCGCVMDPKGYAREWCPLHQQVFREAVRSPAELSAVEAAHSALNDVVCHPLGHEVGAS